MDLLRRNAVASVFFLSFPAAFGGVPADASRVVQMQEDTLAVVERPVDAAASAAGPWRVYGDVTGVQAAVDGAAGTVWFAAAGRVLRLDGDEWSEYVLEGERATWPKITAIHTQTKIVQTLEECLQKLERRRKKFQISHIRTS